MRAVREPVINNDCALLPIYVELDGVAASFVDFMLKENALYALRVLS